jgi:hypothetical protein
MVANRCEHTEKGTLRTQFSAAITQLFVGDESTLFPLGHSPLRRAATFKGMFAQQTVFYNHLQSLFVILMIVYDYKSYKVTHPRNRWEPSRYELWEGRRATGAA